MLSRARLEKQPLHVSHMYSLLGFLRADSVARRKAVAGIIGTALS